MAAIEFHAMGATFLIVKCVVEDDYARVGVVTKPGFFQKKVSLPLNRGIIPEDDCKSVPSDVACKSR